MINTWSWGFFFARQDMIHNKFQLRALIQQRIQGSCPSNLPDHVFYELQMKRYSAVSVVWLRYFVENKTTSSHEVLAVPVFVLCRKSRGFAQSPWRKPQKKEKMLIDAKSGKAAFILECSTKFTKTWSCNYHFPIEENIFYLVISNTSCYLQYMLVKSGSGSMYFATIIVSKVSDVFKLAVLHDHTKFALMLVDRFSSTSLYQFLSVSATNEWWMADIRSFSLGKCADIRKHYAPDRIRLFNYLSASWYEEGLLLIAMHPLQIPSKRLRHIKNSL